LGVGALKFLQDPPSVQASYVGWTVDYNCTTDDPSATVSLSYSRNFGISYTVLQVSPNKLVLRKQVFTLVNLILSDRGLYKCEATDQSGQTIQWNCVSMLILQAAQLPTRHFVLKPNKSIDVLQGQSGEVTCEAEGPSVSTLKWEKQQDDQSYAAVPNRQVNITKDSNYVRATLKITNAQFADAGTYKCTVSVPPNKSDYRLTTVRVKAPSAPKISPYTEKTEILEGSTKAIKCVAEGYPKPTVDWYRSGKKMNVTNCHSNPQSCDKVDYEVYEEGDGSSGRHTIYTVQVLKIRSALYPRDVGEFKCVASNGLSPDAELIVSLDVQVKPTLKERLDAVAVVEDKEAKVSCAVTKSNPLPTFSWQYAFKNLECDIQQPTGTCVPKENKWITVPSELVSPSSSTPTNESTVNVAKDQQNALYRCQAFNSLGNDSQILRFVRLVKPDPMVEIDTGKTMTEVNEKSTLQVFCIDRINGDWGLLFSKDGEKIELSDPRVNVTIFENQPKETERLFKLTIKNVTMNDTGEYGCTISVLFPKLLDAINVTVKGERAKV
ncbi:unnamed protein product, partial [Porites lobata]